MNKGASPNARHSFVIVTDEHKTEGDDCQNVFRWAQKEKNEKTTVFVEYGVAKHRCSDQICSENQGIRQLLHPRIGSLFSVFSAERTALVS